MKFLKITKASASQGNDYNDPISNGYTGLDSGHPSNYIAT